MADDVQTPDEADRFAAAMNVLRGAMADEDMDMLDQITPRLSMDDTGQIVNRREAGRTDEPPVVPSGAAPPPAASPAAAPPAAQPQPPIEAPAGASVSTEQAALATLQGQVSTLTQLLAAQGRQNPVDRTPPPPDPLREFAEAESLDPVKLEAAMAHVVDKRLQPMTQVAQAEQRLVEQFPDAPAAWGQVSEYVRTTPEVAEVVARSWETQDYQGGMRYAYLRWKAEQPVTPPVTPPAAAAPAAEPGGVRQTPEDIAAERVQAGLGGGQTERVTEQVGPAPLTSERYDELVETLHRGYEKPFLREILGSQLPDDIFESR